MPQTEIERKFIIKALPDFVSSTPIQYERYYLYAGNNIELRIQKVGPKYELERKQSSSEHGRTSEKMEISKEEFTILKGSNTKSIIRDCYEINDDKYEISIKVYHDRFEGLIRAEVEFASEEEAARFEPYSWMGQEITDTALGRDSRLIQLTNNEFKLLLKKFTS